MEPVTTLEQAYPQVMTLLANLQASVVVLNVFLALIFGAILATIFYGRH